MNEFYLIGKMLYFLVEELLLLGLGYRYKTSKFIVTMRVIFEQRSDLFCFRI